MSGRDFRDQRRQVFLSEEYYRLNENFIARRLGNSEGLLARSHAAGIAAPSAGAAIFARRMEVIRLRYTAGCAIDSLIPACSDAVAAISLWAREEAKDLERIDGKPSGGFGGRVSPLNFESLEDYQSAVSLASLGLLLGQGELLREFVEVLREHIGTDMLFDELVRVVSPVDEQVTEFFHVEPYDPLVDAFYTAETKGAASLKVKEYLERWYKAFDGVSWHDGHLVVTDEYMAYDGYWAFEAAAICVLHDIDDTPFRDHMVYPKDLADWARANRSVAALKAGSEVVSSDGHSRVAGGEVVPRSGWWFTVAKADLRRYFNEGDTFPIIDSDYGDTFWLWSPDQSAPTL